jgi:hypothetical protein
VAQPATSFSSYGQTYPEGLMLTSSSTKHWQKPDAWTCKVMQGGPLQLGVLVFKAQ